MIDAVKIIGRYNLKKNGHSLNNPLDILTDDPESNHRNPRYKTILFIQVKKIHDQYRYDGIDVEQYTTKKLDKYCYKKGASQGTDFTPTARITRIESEGSSKSTFLLKILDWFNKYKDLSSEIDFKAIYECLENHKIEIENHLKSKFRNINAGESGILSLKIDGKYLGDYKVIRDILVEESKKKYYSKYGRESRSENQQCYLCTRYKNEVFGYVTTFPFSGFDKRGFVAGGFRQEDAWKDYPVCWTCALELESGKKYLKNFLRFSFYGFSYLLIPSFVHKDYTEEIFEITEAWKDPRFKKDEINRLTEDEDEILEILSRKGNSLHLTFLFYDAPRGYDGSEFRVVMAIEDVLPSVLKKIFDTKKKVDKISVFHNFMEPIYKNREKTGERPLEFNFSCVRRFFNKFSENRSYDKYFLDIVNRVFSMKMIDFNFLLKFIMEKIRNEFINQNSTTLSALKGFLLLVFVNKLQILQKEEYSMGKEVHFSSIDEANTEEFFNKFNDFFKSSAYRAVFLLGALTQFLLNIQYSERGAAPFRAKLKGLKLDERGIKRLFPEVQNKLEEYKKNYYKKLEVTISELFLQAGKDWPITNDEISFYFILGMNLSKYFKTTNREEPNE